MVVINWLYLNFSDLKGECILSLTLGDDNKIIICGGAYTVLWNYGRGYIH